MPPLVCDGQLSGRRLQNLGGTVHGEKLIPAPLPSFLAPLLERLASETAAFGVDADQRPSQANHVLVNQYAPGQGIMVGGCPTYGKLPSPLAHSLRTPPRSTGA